MKQNTIKLYKNGDNLFFLINFYYKTIGGGVEKSFNFFFYPLKWIKSMDSLLKKISDFFFW